MKIQRIEETNILAGIIKSKIGKKEGQSLRSCRRGKTIGRLERRGDGTEYG